MNLNAYFCFMLRRPYSSLRGFVVLFFFVSVVETKIKNKTKQTFGGAYDDFIDASRCIMNFV